MQMTTDHTDRLLLEEDGLLSGRITPESAMRLGAVLAEASARCMIGFSPDSAFARAVAYTVCGAAAAAGGQTVLVPDCIPIELGAASIADDCDMILHIDEARMRMFARGLLPLTGIQTEILTAGKKTGWLQRTEYGSTADGEGLRMLYPKEVLRRLPSALRGMPEISTAAPRLYALCQRLFRGGRGELLTFQMSGDGRRVSLYTEKTGWVFYERLLLLLAGQYFAEGRDAALPYWMPRAAEELAANYHRRVLRYASASDGTDAEARALALRQGITLDAAVLCAEFLRMYAEHDGSLTEWLAQLPNSHTVRRIVKLSGAEDSTGVAKRCSAQGQWNTHWTAEGVIAEDARGQALLRPSRSGRSLTLWAEAQSMELAAELAGDLTALLEQ